MRSQRSMAFTQEPRNRRSYDELQRRSPKTKNKKKTLKTLQKSLFSYRWEDDAIDITTRQEHYRISDRSFGVYVNENGLTEEDLDITISDNFVRINRLLVINTCYDGDYTRHMGITTDEGLEVFKTILTTWCRNFEQAYILE